VTDNGKQRLDSYALRTVSFQASTESTNRLLDRRINNALPEETDASLRKLRRPCPMNLVMKFQEKRRQLVKVVGVGRTAQ
jgi:hypothetical protein